MKTKAEVRLTTIVNSKLAFVKAVKNLTGWGLKESKEWSDKIFIHKKGVIEYDIALSKYHRIEDFVADMKSSGFDMVVSSDKYETRKKAFFELGIASEEAIITNATKYLTTDIRSLSPDPVFEMGDTDEEWKRKSAIKEYIQSEEYRNRLNSEMKNTISRFSPELLTKMNLELIKMEYE